jgi:uncharacterized membrane protein
MRWYEYLAEAIVGTTIIIGGAYLIGFASTLNP